MLFPPKVTFQQIVDTVVAAKQRWPGDDLVILCDHLQDARPFSAIVMNDASPSDLGDRDFKNTTFIYASDQDDLGVPFIQFIAAHGGKYLPVSNIMPSQYVHLDSVARTVMESEFLRQTEQGFHKADWGHGDFLNLMQMLNLTREVKGDFVEIGCFEGSSGAVALRYLMEKKIPRRCFFLDVFDGFDYEAAMTSADVIWQGTHKSSGQINVSRRLGQYADESGGVTANVVKSNIITDNLPPEITSISVANIDVDLQEAVFAGLCKVAPYMSVGGMMIAEDAGHTPNLIGARVAVHDFLLTEEAKDFIAIYMESGQTIFVRIGRSENELAVAADAVSGESAIELEAAATPAVRPKGEGAKGGALSTGGLASSEPLIEHREVAMPADEPDFGTE